MDVVIVLLNPTTGLLAQQFPFWKKMPSRRRDFVGLYQSAIAKGVLHGAMCAIGKSRLQNGNCCCLPKPIAVL